MSLKLNSSGGGSVTLQEPTTASNVTLNLPAADGTVNTSGAVNEVPAGSASAPSIYPTGDTNTGIFFPAADTIAFTEGGVETVRFDSSGNLLIGVTTPPTGSSNGLALAAGTLSGSQNISSSRGSTSNSQHITFANPNGQIGGINTNGTSTSFNTSSDYRLKHDIAPMQNALATVAQLKPVTYKWNADNSESQGFIAHELAEVVPDAVIGEKDAVNEDGSIKPQGIDTSFLVATLTAAIQELKAEVDSLRAQVEAQ
jgi:hypothetical protein